MHKIECAMLHMILVMGFKFVQNGLSCVYLCPNKEALSTEVWCLLAVADSDFWCTKYMNIDAGISGVEWSKL